MVLQFALEIAWVAFGNLIAAFSFGTSSMKPVCEWILAEATRENPWCPPGTLTVEAALAELGSTTGMEVDGAEAASAFLSDGDFAGATLSAATLLALVATHAKDLSSRDSNYRDFLGLGRPWWVPMSELASRLNEEVTVHDWAALGP